MSLSRLPIGTQQPALINVIIEIPRGSRNKYEYHPQYDTIMLDRVLHSPLFYPTDYGFIPQTLADDGDPVDVIVLITQPTFPGCVLEVRPIGMLDMEDEAGRDEKIIAVAAHDPYYAHVQEIEDVNIHLKKEIQHFFATYKQLEKNKTTNVLDWHGRIKAHELISAAHQKLIKNLK